MNIYINRAKESWVVDRFRNEWKKYNSNNFTNYRLFADIIWIISPWTWNNNSYKVLKKKFVVCTIHHIENRKEFMDKYKFLDKFVNIYHTPSIKTKESLEQFTNKPIYSIPFWVDQNKFYYIKEKEILKKGLNIPLDDFLVGSFQRDTESSDLISPKLIKGPDLLIKKLEKLNKKYKNLNVILSGKRREYVISELKKRKIKFTYFEMVDFNKLNQLYNILDLYIITSRIEGGPLAIAECAITKTPLISTDVGIASEILSKESIFDLNLENAKPNVEVAYKNIQQHIIPSGIELFNDLFKNEFS